MHKRVKDYLTNATISNIVVISVGVLLYLGVSNFSVVSEGWKRYVGIVSPFICAFAFAYVLNNPIKWFEEKIFYSFKHKKALSITSVYVIFLLVVAALVTAILPQLGQSLLSVTNALPDYLTSISDAATKLTENYNIDPQIAIELENLWTNIVRAATDFALGIIPQVLNFSVSVGNLVVKTLMMLIASIYMLMGKSRLIFQIKKFVYAYFKKPQADRIVEIGQRSNKIFSGFIVGKIIDSTIIGIICFVCMMFIYSPYALLISVIIGVTNMIPFFGPFIGAIPSIFILLMVGGPKVAFIFTIFIIILQQVDGNIIGPKILGDSTGLSAIWVLVAIVVGNGLFGILGMLIGVPTFAVLYSLVSENILYRLSKKGLRADGDNYEIGFDQIGFYDDAN